MRNNDDSMTPAEVLRARASRLRKWAQVMRENADEAEISRRGALEQAAEDEARASEFEAAADRLDPPSVEQA